MRSVFFQNDNVECHSWYLAIIFKHYFTYKMLFSHGKITLTACLLGIQRTFFFLYVPTQCIHAGCRHKNVFFIPFLCSSLLWEINIVQVWGENLLSLLSLSDGGEMTLSTTIVLTPESTHWSWRAPTTQADWSHPTLHCIIWSLRIWEPNSYTLKNGC